MNKVNSFSITRLTLSGFKCFADETVFDFGDMTFINGANHSGKSSIADAIAFAVTGHPFFGDKSSDRLENPKTGAISITMDFTDNTGAKRQLVRNRKKAKTTITLDGYNVRQADLNEIFGERDVFLSIINPLYFIEALADDGKTLLEKLLPPIPHERVLAELNELYRTLLENEKMPSPQTYLRNRRAEIRDLEDALLYQQGQDDSMVTQISGMELQLAEYLQQADERGLTADGSLRMQINDLERDLKDRVAAQYESQYSQTIIEINSDLKTLYDGHAQLTKLRQDGKCPACLQPTSDVESIVTAIADIVSKGKILKGQLKEAEELDEKAKAVFEQFKADDIAKMEEELAALRDRYEKSQKLLDSIEEMQVWLAMNTVSTEKTDAIAEQIEAKKALTDAAVEYISKRGELTFAGLEMEHVSLSLYDVIKSTGEVKDTFKFTFDGRPYRWLSLSEKIRAGLEVAELIKTLTGRCYPTFIDNRESVTHIGNIQRSGQFIFAKVVANQSLSVTYKEQTPSLAAA